MQKPDFRSFHSYLIPNLTDEAFRPLEKKLSVGITGKGGDNFPSDFEVLNYHRVFTTYFFGETVW